MNYIGSKRSLLPEISRILDDAAVPSQGFVLDLFAGTGAVARLLKQRGHIVYANDWQQYSYVTNVALIECDDLPGFDSLLSNSSWRMRILWTTNRLGIRAVSSESSAALVLQYLGQLPGHRGAFYEAYCEGGRASRLYFSVRNGLRIQAIRDKIEEWAEAELITASEKAWLIACLIESADRVANTASVYGAYLKQIKSSAQRELSLCPLQPVRSSHGDVHKAFCCDSQDLLRHLSETRHQLVYIDPPYNRRQYNANYHVLETLTRWDLHTFEPRGITGLRSAYENRSDYCIRARALGSFRELFSLLNSDYVLFSYNNEGVVPVSSLQDLFDEFCTDVQFNEITHRRFRADSDGETRSYKPGSTSEFLILGKLRRNIPAAEELLGCTTSTRLQSVIPLLPE